MTISTSAILFMGITWLIVIGLNVYCFVRVMKTDAKK